MIGGAAGQFDPNNMIAKSAQGLEAYRPVTLRQELSGAIARLEEQIAVKRELLNLLDGNPAIEKFMDLAKEVAVIQPVFMDELELRTDAEVDHILDVYCNDLGLTQICIGPAYAKQYDHPELPPIDWALMDPRPLFRKLRQRNLHITLAAFPTDPPFWDGSSWNFALFEQEYGVTLQNLQAEGLVDSIRFAWETFSSSAQMCQGVTWLRGIFPVEIPIRYHNKIGHLSPCLSSEPEQAGWRAFLAAGGSGLDLQSAVPSERPDALQQMLYDLWDMRRRATGTDGSPWGGPLLTNQGVPMTVRNAEYSAYDIFHNGLPWTTAQEFGRQGMTVTGPGDDTALDGI